MYCPLRGADKNHEIYSKHLKCPNEGSDAKTLPDITHLFIVKNVLYFLVKQRYVFIQNRVSFRAPIINHLKGVLLSKLLSYIPPYIIPGGIIIKDDVCFYSEMVFYRIFYPKNNRRAKTGPGLNTFISFCSKN
jgi:hypothetical protein